MNTVLRVKDDYESDRLDGLNGFYFSIITESLTALTSSVKHAKRYDPLDAVKALCQLSANGYDPFAIEFVDIP